MSKNRLEAFSDGVMAIVITVIVLNIATPKGDGFGDLMAIFNQLLVYAISFIFVGIYWINHHHLFQVIDKVDWKIIWSNNIFLFFLTLLPLSTNWLGHYFFSLMPQLVYGLIILVTDICFLLLVMSMIQAKKLIVLNLTKNYVSIAINLAAIIAGYTISPVLVSVINIGMVILWLVPDKKIEALLNKKQAD